MSFVNWHLVHIIDISTRAREKFFVPMLSWWSEYDGSHLLVVPSPMLFDYRSTLELRAASCGLFFRVAILEHYVFSMLIFFTSVWVGGPAD